MDPSCVNCGSDFEVTHQDLQFLNEISPVFNGKKELIPPPTQCPACRTQRRMAWRNHCYVYRNPNPSPQSAGFSMWPPESAFPSYENSLWFSDSWNPLASGQDISFDQPFFPQFLSVHNESPHFALDAIRMENSDYSNNADDCRRCYLCFNISISEDCIGCDNTISSRDCLDCTRIFTCEQCYGCIDCERCYGLQESRGCENCSNSLYLLNCRSCKNCIGCVNLSHKEYYVFNEQKTPGEYAAIKEELSVHTWAGRQALSERFESFAATFPRPHAIMHMAEDSTGNYLVQCNDVQDSMFIHTGEHLRHCQLLFGGTHHCQDVTLFGIHVESCYEGCVMGLDAMRCHFCMSVWEGTSDMLYSTFCVSCSNCFGCTGLHRKKYCILNKQYTKEEYEELVPRIIEHMRQTGEWGEFFPIAMSPVPYNRSLAQIFYPLEEQAIREKGYVWYGESPANQEHASQEHIDLVPTDTTPRVLRSTLSGRPYKLTTIEIAAYQRFGSPLPRTTYDERITKRSRSLGGIKLCDRTCTKTGKPIKTTIPPDSPLIVWDRDEWEKEFGS